jgi:N-acetylmuramoyl-L-alanine amidase
MSKILYIDAGHGALDSNGNYTTPAHKGKWFDHKKGTFHKNSIFYEGVWNRAFAAEFIKQATNLGFQCIPVYHPVNDNLLGERVELANESYKKHKEGTYLSFHSNASNSTARGFYLFHHPQSKAGKQMASGIVQNINSVFTSHGSISSRPLREGYMNEKKDIYYVLQATNMPALLFEFGFFDNFYDATMLMDKAFIFELAATVAIELHKYLNKDQNV